MPWLPVFRGRRPCRCQAGCTSDRMCSLVRSWPWDPLAYSCTAAIRWSIWSLRPSASRIRTGHDERTLLRYSRISIARCADLVRSPASAWGPLSWSFHRVTGAGARDQRPCARDLRPASGRAGPAVSRIWPVTMARRPRLAPWRATLAVGCAPDLARLRNRAWACGRVSVRVGGRTRARGGGRARRRARARVRAERGPNGVAVIRAHQRVAGIGSPAPMVADRFPS